MFAPDAAWASASPTLPTMPQATTAAPATGAYDPTTQATTQAARTAPTHTVTHTVPPRRRIWAYRVLSSFPHEKRRLRSAIQSMATDLSIPPSGEREELGVLRGELQQILRDAQRALDEYEVDTGWSLVHQVARRELRFADRHELRDATERVHSEVRQKLRGWRRQCAERACREALTLLRSDSVSEEQLAAARMRLVSAMRIRDEHFANMYAGMRLARYKALSLMFAVAGLLVLMLVVAATLPEQLAWLAVEPPRRDVRLAAHPFSHLGQAMLFGMIGALFSASTTRAPADARPLPQQMDDWTLLLARPVLGAVGALVVVTVVQAGSLGLRVENAAGLALLCFASGFSERFAVRFLDRAPDGGRRNDDRPPPDERSEPRARTQADDGADRSTHGRGAPDAP